MKKIILSLACLMTFAFAFVSCSKQDDDSYYNVVAGRWTFTAGGIDNGNMIPEADELQQIPDTNVSVTFNADGTGYGNVNVGYFDISSGFNWGLADYEKTLWIAKEGDTARMSIQSISLSEMVLLNKTVTVFGNGTWHVLKKY